MKYKVKKIASSSTLVRLLGYMAQKKLRFFLIVIFTFTSSLASVIGTSLLEPIVNEHLLPFVGNKEPDMSGLISKLIILAIVYITGAVTMYIQKRLVMFMTNDTLLNLREDLITTLLSMPVKYFDDRTDGEIISRFTNDVEAVRVAVNDSLTEIVGAIITLSGIFIVMITSNVALTALAVLMFCIMFFVIRRLGSVSGAHFRKQQIIIGDANGFIEEMVEGQSVVKVFNHEDKTVKDFNGILDNLEKISVKANTFANYIMPVTFNISYFHYIITAVLGGYMAIFGSLNIGKLISFMQYVRMLGNPITQVSQQFNAILMAMAGAERIFNILDMDSEVDKGDVTLVKVKYDEKNNLIETDNINDMYGWKYKDAYGQVKYKLVKGEVEFKNVTFGYDSKHKVLKNISIDAKPGQKIALVGSTGAGKTTITNLLTRFYEIDSGDILYDGINIKHIKKADLRRSLSIVLQDTNLFSETVFDNIRFGRLDATDEEIIEAAKLANAHDFIMNLPKGYDTILTDGGSSLSQGQRQLLSIARASVANPVTLILDEATSSIDTRTEKLIQEGMDKLMENRTTFVIAHRLSTIQNADVIMVLEHGEILEFGSHDSLIKNKGRYYQLYTGMFELS